MSSPVKDPQAEAVRAAWSRYALLLVGLALTFLMATVAVWPWPYTLAVERFMLPQYETKFGFRGGRVAVVKGDTNHTIYALVDVVPGGPMARAGAAPGDIPIHVGELYFALQRANSGSEGQFAVLPLSGWPDWGKRRTIVLRPDTNRAQ